MPYLSENSNSMPVAHAAVISAFGGSLLEKQPDDPFLPLMEQPVVFHWKMNSFAFEILTFSIQYKILDKDSILPPTI